MIPVSYKWKEYSKENFIYNIRAQLVDGNGYSMVLTNEDFMLGEVYVRDSISPEDSFRFGTVISNTFEATLNNYEGKFNLTNFKGAKITVEFGVVYEIGLEEWITRGVYNLERPRSLGETISIIGYDNMDKFNIPYDGKRRDGTPFSGSPSRWVYDLCEKCGVIVGDITCLDVAGDVPDFPWDKGTTCRDVLGWICEAHVCYARITNVGELSCVPYQAYYWTRAGSIYDGGKFNPWETGETWNGYEFDPWNIGTLKDGGIIAEMSKIWEFDKIAQTRVDIDRTNYTGVRIFIDGENPDAHYDHGNAGYIYAITDNPILQTRYTDFNFARFTIDIAGTNVYAFEASVYGNPAVEAGDSCIIFDYRGTACTSIITSLTYRLNGLLDISMGTETPEEIEMYNYDFGL